MTIHPPPQLKSVHTAARFSSLAGQHDNAVKLETERYNTFALYFGADNEQTKAAKESLMEITRAKVANDVSAARNKIANADAIAKELIRDEEGAGKKKKKKPKKKKV
jgi:predicted DNA-binding protein (UPF0251 family)